MSTGIIVYFVYVYICVCASTPMIRPTGCNADSLRTLPSEFRYCFVHDNGGRPFRVSLMEFRDDGGGKLIVHKHIVGKPYQVALEPIEFVKIWFGRDKKLKPCSANNTSIGNNVLFLTREHVYTHIGGSIREFKAFDSDPIKEFASPIGNNDVPYAFATSAKSVWCFLHEEIVKIPIEQTVTFKDPFGYLFGHHLWKREFGKRTVNIPMHDAVRVDKLRAKHADTLKRKYKVRNVRILHPRDWM